MNRLEFVSILPGSLEKVWEFFSSPENLRLLTPPKMNFLIVSRPQGAMYPGMMIRYKVTPLPGMRVGWLTEITQLRNGEFFIDEQRVGPYKLWHHEHHFLEHPDGVEMRDILHYQLPLGFLGDIVDRLFIEDKVKSIFSFREEAIKRHFPGSLSTAE